MLGEVLFGRYRVDALLSSTPAVDVWRGADLHALEPVHIKVWGPDQDPGAALLEGEAMAAARHPGMVRLVDFGLHEGHQPCLMMESVAGETLAERMRRVGPLAWAEAFEIGAQVLDALAALHDEGLVHCDVSPHSVVLLPDSRRTKLVGLQHVGLAGNGDGRIVDDPPAGVLEYKAPEQLGGAGVRPGTDLYALGVTLWEAISGACAFAAEPGSIAARMSWRPDLATMPKRARALPLAAKIALDRMLRPSLAHREGDARVCGRRLRAAMGIDVTRMPRAWARAAS
jgi:serine/threonine protein kinase